MEEFDLIESKVYQSETNQFLDDVFQYQICPNCTRKFFIGKLKYHLKLCKPNNPMTKSPLKKIKRSYFTADIQNQNKNAADQILNSQRSQKLNKQQKFQKCQNCKSSYSQRMFEDHKRNCINQSSLQQNPQSVVLNESLKSKTKIDFKKSSILPRIQNSARQKKTIQKEHAQISRKHKIQQEFSKELEFKEQPKSLKPAPYTIKIRQDLRCFRKASQVQVVCCQFCCRKFSRQASLRHIPICEKQHQQQKNSLVKKPLLIKKHSKSQIYKLNIPLKKATLFGKKFTSSLSKDSVLQIEPKSKSNRVVNTPTIQNKKSFSKNQISRQHNYSQSKVIKKETTLNQKRQEYFNINLTIRKQLDMNMTFSKDFNIKNDIQPIELIQPFKLQPSIKLVQPIQLKYHFEQQANHNSIKEQTDKQLISSHQEKDDNQFLAIKSLMEVNRD